ncbi:PleD family two-component system response regulator [Rickettsiales bacterium]|nr:PleD family two-component system response regulator [Rickettsiales bacterium]
MAARILVVDDLPQNIKLLSAKLTAAYYDVFTADNGPDALGLVAENPPDIILLDVMMPKMDGFEVCRKLKANPSTTHIPVIMVTALNDMAHKVRGLSVGADDFLTKPIDDVALFARIKSLARLKTAADELLMRDKTREQFGLFAGEVMSYASQIHEAKVLIVDDDLAQTFQMKKKLEKVFAGVNTCDDPSKAIDLASEGKYGMIIVSTNLLDFDGLRLCSQLLSNDSTRGVPILISVEEEHKDKIIQGLEMGVSDYIIAPIDENELLARVSCQVRRKRYHDALRNNLYKGLEMAVTDDLTQIYNRRYFDMHLDGMFTEAREKSKNLSIAIIDVDYFKQVNDTLGHIAGDEVLQQIAQLISQNARATDLIARYGGEEFALIMPGTDIKEASLVMERIRKLIANFDFKISTKEDDALKKTISVGLACVADKHREAKQVLEEADKNLYAAKEQGRNRVIC